MFVCFRAAAWLCCVCAPRVAPCVGWFMCVGVVRLCGPLSVYGAAQGHTTRPPAGNHGPLSLTLTRTHAHRKKIVSRKSFASVGRSVTFITTLSPFPCM